MTRLSRINCAEGYRSLGCVPCTRITNEDNERAGRWIGTSKCGGRAPRTGLKLENLFTEDGVLKVIERVVYYYKTNGKPRQRLGALMEEAGLDALLKAVYAETQD